MTISHGTRLGRYEIVGPIGSGGMEEVYRATDSALRRDVALKILPAALINSRADEGTRIWRVGAEGGEPRPLSDPVIGSWFYLAISPDARRIAATDTNQVPYIWSLEEQAPPEAIPGTSAGDMPVHWPDERTIYVCRPDEKKSDIFAIDLETGARRFVRTMQPPDAAGVQGVFPVLFASGNESYAFGYKLLLTNLFTVGGLG